MDPKSLGSVIAANGNWKLVHRNTLAITGGLQVKGASNAPCMYYTMDGTIWPFVELDKNARWFLNTVGGSVTNKGDLKTVNVLSEIRARFAAAVADDDSAVAEDSQDKGDIDRMDTLVDANVKPKATPKGKKALNRAEVRTLVMPLRPACAGRDGESHRIIHVYAWKCAQNKNDDVFAGGLHGLVVGVCCR